MAKSTLIVWVVSVLALLTLLRAGQNQSAELGPAPGKLTSRQLNSIEFYLARAQQDGDNNNNSDNNQHQSRGRNLAPYQLFTVQQQPGPLFLERS